MKRLIRTAELLFVILILSHSSLAQTAVAPATGDGLTTETAYQITELGNLVWMEDEAIAGNTEGKYYKLMNDIDASATAGWNDSGTSTDKLEGFTPIGTVSTKFDGVFLGNDFTLNGLTINRPTKSTMGLFGYISSTARIQHLSLANVSITASSSAGAVAGYNRGGSILNCSASGSITGSGNYVGGIAGYNFEGVISNCNAAVETSATKYCGGVTGHNHMGDLSDCVSTGAVKNAMYGGGLVGSVFGGTITRCTSNGDVMGSGAGVNSYIGGLAGWVIYCCDIEDCHASGRVYYGWKYAGGLIGYLDTASTLTGCTASGDVSSYENVGGLAGYSNATLVKNCKATGEVQGTFYTGGLTGYHKAGAITSCIASGEVNGCSWTGGLIGFVSGGTLTGCRAEGAVTGSGECTGGLAGYAQTSLNVSDCHSTGSTTGADNYVGGLIGEILEGGSVSECTASGPVTGQGDYTGGLIGLFDGDGSISDSYSTREVFGADNYVGGLIGEILEGGSVSECTASGPVTGQGDYTGGLIGLFDGDGSISDSYSTSEVFGADNYVGGLIGCYNSSIAITGLNKTSGNVTGQGYFTGGLLGCNGQASISDCYTTCDVTGNSYTGGLIGEFSSSYSTKISVNNCYSTGDIKGAGRTVGGLLGCSSGAVSNCHASGNVSGEGFYIGGLLGINNSPSVSYCSASGNVSGPAYVGGLMGSEQTKGTVSFCHATGAVKGSRGRAGGLVGNTWGSGFFSHCYATGPVSGFTCVGGLAGYIQSSSDLKFSTCYSSSNVSGQTNVGGLAGEIYAPARDNEIINCYASGNVTAASNVGGVAGYCYGGKISTSYSCGRVSIAGAGDGNGGLIGFNDPGYYLVWITDSFWNAETALLDVSDGGTSLTTAQMMQQATFEDAGWDFESVWALDGGYPYLQELDACSLTYRSGENGRIEDALTTQAALLTQTINLGGGGAPVWAVGDEGYGLSTWSDDNQDNPRIDRGVLTDLDVTAIFSDHFTLTYTAGDHGSVSGETTQSVALDGSGTPVEAIPDTGYYFSQWSDGSTNNPRQDENITENLSFTAWFNNKLPPAAPETGDGSTTETAFQIKTLANLVWLGDQAKAGATAAKYYILMNDIDASETENWNDDGATTETPEGFVPIGDATAPFEGVFLGEENSISHLMINRPGETYTGLFGVTNDGARIKNLELTNASISGSCLIGGLIGYNAGASVAGCQVSGSVSGSIHVGGLIGDNTGNVADSKANCAVTGINKVGGLIGYQNESTVTACCAKGAVTGANNVGGLIGYQNESTVSGCCAKGAVEGESYVGGLAGDTEEAVLSGCYATGDVTGEYYDAGGLIGLSYKSTVSGCYATGNVSGGNYYTGGLIGYNVWYSSMTECYATGDVEGTDSVGGLAGCNVVNYTTHNCYSTGAVTGEENVGGLIGENGEADISYCYALGTVSGTLSVGGLIGDNYTTSIFTACYWNTETSGQASSYGGAGLTTLEMKQTANFEGWDFEEIWGIEGAYPYLRGLPTCTMTYKVDKGGTVGDGVTDGVKKLPQVINPGGAGTPVTATPNDGFQFGRWSDSPNMTDPVRTDGGYAEDMTFQANFAQTNGAREWMGYR